MKPRWLLDHNIPAPLAGWLAEQGIQAETAFELGWHELADSELLRRASKTHHVLLTRDKRFDQSAKFRQAESTIAVVVLQLPQAPAAKLLSAVEEAWAARPIQSQPGDLIRWP